MNSSWGSGTDVDANLDAQDTLSVDHGAYVASVVQYGAALAAAILVGDLIVQIDNTPVTDSQSLGLAKRWRNIVWGHSGCASGWSGIEVLMNVRNLAIKFSSYAHYAVSREWARECSMLPALVCIVPDIGQERRMIRVVRTRLTQAPGLVLWITTEVLLNEYGPLVPIWLKNIPQRSQVELSSAVRRQLIFDVVPEKIAI